VCMPKVFVPNQKKGKKGVGGWVKTEKKTDRPQIPNPLPVFFYPSASGQERQKNERGRCFFFFALVGF